jgi:membrane peptidoglycan carboxypeptidase
MQFIFLNIYLLIVTTFLYGNLLLSFTNYSCKMIKDLVERVQDSFFSPQKKIQKYEKQAKKYLDLKKEINVKGGLPLRKKLKYGMYGMLAGSMLFSGVLASNWLIKPQTPFIGKYSHWLDKGIALTLYNKRDFIEKIDYDSLNVFGIMDKIFKDKIENICEGDENCRQYYFNEGINVPECPSELKIFNNSAKIVSSEFDLENLTNKNNSEHEIKNYGKWTPLESLPKRVEDAIIISEDAYLKNFENRPFFSLKRGSWRDQHAGVDLWSLPQAIKEKRGGSTIDAQIASNYVNQNRRGVFRYFGKLEEYILAYKIHDQFSHDERLVNYVNNVAFPKNNIGVVAGARNLLGVEPEEANYRDLFTLFSWVPAPARYFSLIRARSEGYENLKSGNGGRKGDKEYVFEVINHINSRLKTTSDLGLITDAEYKRWVIDTSSSEAINRSLRGLPLKIDYLDKKPGAEPRSQYGMIKELERGEFKLTFKNGYEEYIRGLELLDKKGGVVIKLATDVDLTEYIKNKNYEFIKGDFQDILRRRNDCAKKLTFHSTCWEDDVKGYDKNDKPLPYERNFESYMDYLSQHVNVGTIVIKYDKDSNTNKIISYVPSLELFHKSGYPSLSKYHEIPSSIFEDKLINVRKEVIGFEEHTNIGSFFKPLWFYHMMIDNIRPDTPLQDVKFLKEDVYGKKFRAPNNSDGVPTGKWFTAEHHLAKSKNAVFADYYIGDNTLQNRVKNQFDNIQFQYDKDDIKWYTYAIGGSWTYTLEAASLMMSFLEKDGKYKLPSFIDKILIDGQEVDFEITDTGKYFTGRDSKTGKREYEMKTVKKVPKKFLTDKKARELTFQAMKKTGEIGTVSTIKRTCIDCEGNVAGKTHTENTRKNAGVGIIYSSYSDFSDAY